MRWHRFWRGCRKALLVATASAIVIVAWNWRFVNAFAANLAAVLATPKYLGGPRTLDQMLAYLAKRRADIALTAYTVAPDGGVVDDGAAIFHNADTPLPLASTMKIIVLAAYAQAIERGQLAPDTPVRLAEWERYYLPGSDGGAHTAMLKELGVTPTETGAAADPQAITTLDQVVRAMIRYSDNAATDLLIERVGPGSIRATISAAELQHQDLILPLVGTILAWHNHEQPRQAYTIIDDLKAGDFAAEAQRLTAAYRDPQWAAAEQRWRSQPANMGLLRYQAYAAAELLPRGTAREYAAIMARVATGTFLSPQVSQIMRRHLEWPLDMENSAIRDQFSLLGSKGGSVPGVLTEASFFLAKQGDFAGRPRVVVLFVSNMPIAAWLNMMESFAQQLLMREIALGRAATRRAAAALHPAER